MSTRRPVDSDLMSKYETLHLDDDPETPQLRARTSGCGCCAAHDEFYTKKSALQALREQEDSLKQDLLELRQLRKRVRETLS